MGKSTNINTIIGTLPRSWDDMTVAQFLAINDNLSDDNFELLIEILTGKPIDSWGYISQNDIEAKILPAIAYLSKAPNLKKIKLPLFITIGNKAYRVPHNPRLVSIHKTFLFQNELIKLTDEGGNISNKIIPLILAINYCPKPKATFKDIEVFAALTNQTLLSEAYPVASHLLVAWLRKLLGKQKIQQNPNGLLLLRAIQSN